MTINEHDNLLIYMCGHANEDFFKIADRYYLCKEEITELVSYLRKRVGKLMVIVDTCQAECLIDRDKILNNNKYNNKYNSNILNNDNILNNNKYNDNIIILTTSIYNQYSYSTHVNNILGINIVDDFIYELYNNILNSNTDILNSNISNNTNILYNDNNISNIRNIRNISNNNNISNIRNIRNISNNKI
ncbi:GPI-anchor transamidase-like [Ecytonucleospora hepatopenaei]|uniref:GPI-anchor transamidase-like n=1 Tax=Ecytonucleospora hepatopenaei TaxID=646526 RepID=A0A1W0E3P5_9MICR|nr:GPI-anchor transamidase-like [Ecytonucleospora hepatopenaei]